MSVDDAAESSTKKNASGVSRLDLDRVTAYQTDEEEEEQDSEISPVPLTPFE